MSYLDCLFAIQGWTSQGCSGAAIQAKVVAFNFAASSSIEFNFRRGNLEGFRWVASL